MSRHRALCARADRRRRCPTRTTRLRCARGLFTTGSIGRPNDSAMQYDSAVDLIRRISDEYNIDAHDGILFTTPATFEASAWEFSRP